MKKKISKILSLVSTAAVVFALVLFTYAYLNLDIFKTKANIEKLITQINEKIAKNSELDAIQKNTKLKNSERELLSSFFIIEDSVVEFIQLVESVAKNSGLQISTKNIEPKESADLASINKELISVTVETRGEWQNTEQFLGLLSNLPFKISINSLSVAHSEGVSNKDSEKGDVVLVGATWNTIVSFDVIKTKKDSVADGGVKDLEIKN